MAKTRDTSRPLTRLSDSVTTLAERLGSEGYRTAAIVTNPLLHPVSGIARGFRRFEILGGPTSKMPRAALGELDELLGLTWSGLRKALDVNEPPELDEETRRRLEALGYL